MLQTDLYIRWSRIKITFLYSKRMFTHGGAPQTFSILLMTPRPSSRKVENHLQYNSSLACYFLALRTTPIMARIYLSRNDQKFMWRSRTKYQIIPCIFDCRTIHIGLLNMCKSSPHSIILLSQLQPLADKYQCMSTVFTNF